MKYNIAIIAVLGCRALLTEQAAAERNFGQDVQFLSQHVETIVLGNDTQGPRIVVVPAYQGRVMTSTSTGNDGTSYGWINYDHIQAGKVVPQINVYGGEERFWLGPEGGQFAIFFKPGDTFQMSQWQTPAVIDTDSFQVVKQSPGSVHFHHEAELTNMSATRFQVGIDREIRLLSNASIAAQLEVALGKLRAVGYQTKNRLTNLGDADWTKESGLLSIWMLGIYKHGPQTTVVIPFVQGDASKLGTIVNDEYFGKVPDDRLKIGEGVLFFSGDGQYRSKIGLSPSRSTSVCGSYDAARQVLTIVKYNKPGPEATEYVNSAWETQEQPYAGDVVNSYNDGPAEKGAKPLGPFYELETSSPALALATGATAEHIQETYHLEGELAELDRVARQVLGVSLETIRTSLE